MRPVEHPHESVHNVFTCRSLYPLLSKYAALVGLWRSVGEGPAGSLYEFSWGTDCVEGVQLVHSSPFRF